MDQRLDKLVAANSEYSRKETKELIRGGRVLVNGAQAQSGQQKVSFDDVVTLDGRALRNQAHLYIMLNKPRGVVCATRDHNCPTVLDLLPAQLRRAGLFPAGRLDKDTEGFVLITDDGDFAHRILSPASHVPKTYLATLDKPFDPELLRRDFLEGLVLDGGDVCSPAELTLEQAGPQPVVRLVIYEGMYHQVKRMFGVYRLQVLALKRIAMGGLGLDPALEPGQAREILPAELALVAGAPLEI